MNANLVLYLNPVLSKDEVAGSMRELIEWGRRLHEVTAGEGEEKGMGPVVVIQNESGWWAECYNKFADANLGVSEKGFTIWCCK